MFEKIKSLFTTQEEHQENPDDQIAGLLTELEQGITTADSSILEAKENEKNLKQNISILFTDLERAKERAKRFIEIGNKIESENSFKKVKSLESQLTQYGRLLADVEQTIQEIESQKSHFFLKKNEIHSKQLLYQVKIKGAQNQASIQGNIMNSLNFDEFSSYENLLQEAHAKAEAIAEINNDFNSYKQEEKPNDSLESFRKEIDREKQEKEEAAIQKEKAKIDALFSRMRVATPPVKLVATDKKQEELNKKREVNSFFEKAKNTQEDKKMDDFFNKKPDSKEDKLKNFFKD